MASKVSSRGMSSAPDASDYFRFCPGEERIKISNAICRGRRRSSFPRCAGCQFNDDEKAREGAVGRGAAPSQGELRLDSVFHPLEIRGKTPAPLSEDVAWRIGHAAAQFLHGRLRGYERTAPNARCLIIGQDARPSSAALARAAAEGIRSVGVDVIDLGVIDTPQLTFAVQRTGACGGLQTTGGPRAYDENGFVLCGPRGTAIDESTGLASIRDIASRMPRHQTGSAGRTRSADLTAEYIAFVRQPLGTDARLAVPLKVVVDACNGVAAHWAPRIAEGIDGLTLELLHAASDQPFPHEPDPRYPQATADLRRQVRQSGANLGVCFSPDAETCAFVDEKGAAVPADLAGALLARMLLERHRGAGAVLDLRSSTVAFDEIERAGGVACRERVGRTFIRKRMTESDAVFGADLTGRFYFRDAGHAENAFLAWTHLLSLLSAARRGLSELVRPLLRSRTSGEVQFRCADLDAAIRRISAEHGGAILERIDGLSVRYPDWWFHVRPGEGEGLAAMTLEARTRKLVDQRLAELTPLLGERVQGAGA